MRSHFRFEALEIWHKATELAVKLHSLADRLESGRMLPHAEQLRGASLSLPDNIAEGSARMHAKKFAQFLNITRRSLFEDASLLLSFEKLGLTTPAEIDGLLTDCDELSLKVTNFSRRLEE